MLVGGLVMAVATLPYALLTATTSFVLIDAAMVVRGIGIGLPVMPAMTAAFSFLPRGQVDDASPQLTVLQRVGGSFGTAILAVALQAQINHAHTPAATAAGFGHTYWWVMGITLIALLPTLVLARSEHRHADRPAAPAPRADARLRRRRDPSHAPSLRALVTLGRECGDHR